MSKLNPSLRRTASVDKTERLAGGTGAYAAKQDNYNLLRRAVLTCLLWEDMAYSTGKDNTDNIANLIPKVEPEDVAQLVKEARFLQKLRHVPLYMISEMSKYNTHKLYVKDLLQEVITRPDQITDFVAIYWKEGKRPLSAQIKKGLAAAFCKFNEYQFAKYDRNSAIKLRDVYFLVHPKAKDAEQYILFDKIAKRTLTVPDTWEVALSAGKDKKAVFSRLIKEKKLGGLAFLRNIRNMKDVGVNPDLIKTGLANLKSEMLLPLNFFGAAQHAPEYKNDINKAMLKLYEGLPKIKGLSIFVVDVSGSMNVNISSKSQYTRLSVACVMAMLAAEMCENVIIYLTAGSDHRRVHKTMRLVTSKRGFDLIEEINKYVPSLGGGGIFTRQALEYIKSDLNITPDRIIVFSDSADCDSANKIPNPFGKNNYIVDVSSERRGINYKGKWTAEISGWSEHFLNYVASYEGVNNTFEEE